MNVVGQADHRNLAITKLRSVLNGIVGKANYRPMLRFYIHAAEDVEHMPTKSAFTYYDQLVTKTDFRCEFLQR